MQQHSNFANQIVSLKSSVKTSDLISPIWSQPSGLNHTFYSKLPDVKLYSPSPLNPFLIYYTNPDFIFGERKVCYPDVMTSSMTDGNLPCSLNCLVGNSYNNLSEVAKRKVSTRESSATLKAWLNDHRKNPYPTKSEKVMLSVITKMTLTQVSTWFANARRRLKKETKNNSKTFLGSQEAYPSWLSSSVKDLENSQSNNLDDSVDIDVFNCSSTEIISLEESSASIQFSKIHCDDYVTSSVDICCQQPLNSDHKKKSKHISDCVESNKDQEFQSLLLKSLSSPPLLTQPPSQSLSSSTSLIQCFGSCQSSLSAPLKSSSEIVTMLSSLNCSNRIEPLEGCKKNKIWSIDDLISSGNSKADLESEHEAEFRRSSNSSDNM